MKMVCVLCYRNLVKDRRGRKKVFWKLGVNVNWSVNLGTKNLNYTAHWSRFYSSCWSNAVLVTFRIFVYVFQTKRRTTHETSVFVCVNGKIGAMYIYFIVTNGKLSIAISQANRHNSNIVLNTSLSPIEIRICFFVKNFRCQNVQIE